MTDNSENNKEEVTPRFEYTIKVKYRRKDSQGASKDAEREASGGGKNGKTEEEIIYEYLESVRSSSDVIEIYSVEYKNLI